MEKRKLPELPLGSVWEDGFLMTALCGGELTEEELLTELDTQCGIPKVKPRSVPKTVYIKRVSDGKNLVGRLYLEDTDLSKEPQDNVNSACIYVSNRDFKIRVWSKQCDAHGHGSTGKEAINRIREELAKQGLTLRVCFTCKEYYTSGIIAGWSCGTEGKCRIHKGSDDQPFYLVNNLQTCKQWAVADG